MGWLAGWTYRKSHTITGSVDGAQTFYQVPIKVYFGAGADGTEVIGDTTWGKVYCNSHPQIDFDDIRFTKADGTSELDYWIEYYSASGYALIWVEVESIPEDPDTVDIYIYYGNAAVGTTSSMANTWVDSLDWGADLTGDFDTYTKDGVRARVYLKPTPAELPLRVITHFMVTYWAAWSYGTGHGLILIKNAETPRGTNDWIVYGFSSDTDHGADADTFVPTLQVNDSGVVSTLRDLVDFSLNTIYISEMRAIADTRTEGELLSAGRAAQLASQLIEDCPDAINYMLYNHYYGGGPEGTNYWNYDAVNDRIEWGGRRTTLTSWARLESPFSVFGKWTLNEPTPTSWGAEEGGINTMIGGPTGWVWGSPTVGVSVVRKTTDGGLTYSWVVLQVGDMIPDGDPLGWDWVVV